MEGKDKLLAKFHAHGGGITKSEDLRRVLVGVGMPEADISVIFSAAGVKRDGKVDIEDFLSFLYDVGQTQTMDCIAMDDLRRSDNRLLELLRSGSIRLLRASWLLQRANDWRMQCRQDLEELEQNCQSPFLLPNEAANLVARGLRLVAALSYGWLTPENPDPGGALLAALKKFLHSMPGVEGLFWDFASLPQYPRTPAEDKIFDEALQVMGDLYASISGVMVLQFKRIPLRPPEYDGYVHVFQQHPRDFNVAALCSALGKYGEIVGCECRRAGVCVRFATHKEAEHAVQALQLDRFDERALPQHHACISYRDVPYERRGWCQFEEAVSKEVVAWCSQYPSLQQVLRMIAHPKLLEITTMPPAEVELPKSQLPNFEDTRALLEGAIFTGRSDKRKVVNLFSTYRSRLSEFLRKLSNDALQVDQISMQGYGEWQFVDGSVYRGEFMHGQMCGQGEMRYSCGMRYDGQWVAGQREGHGELIYPDGETYEGDFKDNLFDGHGEVIQFDGASYTGGWKSGKKEGHGICRHTDGQVEKCYYRSGELVGEAVPITLDQALAIAAQNNLELPAQ